MFSDRFLHDSAFEYLSACSECGWQGTETGTGAGHWSGGWDSVQPSSSSTSRRNQESGRGSGSGRQYDHKTARNNSSSSNTNINTNTNTNSGIEYQQEYHNDYGNEDENGNEYGIPNEESCDLWVCLVCGFIGCGSSHCDHIRAHYLTHMHAYAMNTGTYFSLNFNWKIFQVKKR